MSNLLKIFIQTLTSPRIDRLLKKQPKYAQEFYDTEVIISAHHINFKILNNTFFADLAIECREKAHRQNRVHRCMFCQKTFTSTFVLKRHINIHTGAIQYTYVLVVVGKVLRILTAYVGMLEPINTCWNPQVFKNIQEGNGNITINQ